MEQVETDLPGCEPQGLVLSVSVWEGNQFYDLQDHNAVSQRQHACHTGLTSAQLYRVNTHLSYDLVFVLCIM